MPTPAADYAEWIGRSEERRDIVTPGPLDRLAATLDRDDPGFENGDPIPPLAHWLLFLPSDRQSVLGPDGHPRRGGFLPPVHDMPRRMWAGSRISFPAELRVGQEVERRSTIASVRKSGGTSGPLVFVTVRHEIRPSGGVVAVVDEHDIVYRGLEGAAVKTSVPPARPGEWRRTLVTDTVMLFRYSALTFNGHRIHYDRDYATKLEGYPGLVVHGPLIATLLADLIRRRRPEARIAALSFRAVSPLFEGQEMSLNATAPGGEGVVELWAANAAGGLAMTAQARLAPGPTVSIQA